MCRGRGRVDKSDTLPTPLDGRAVLVTGGLGGIGLGIARELTARGARVYLGHRPGAPTRDVQTLEAQPVESQTFAAVRYIALDVVSEDDWARCLDVIRSECGAVHGLVNNAAVLEPATAFTELTLAQWRRHMAVNLDGVFLGCRLAMQTMASTGGGAIVNVSSAAANLGVPDAAAYCVSKSAVLTLTRVAAKAGGRHGVRVNAVLPGAIDTPMLRRNVAPGEPVEAFIESLTRHHPIGRIGTTHDVAAAVAFLLDPGNGFITGALLAVDGGQLVD